MGSDLTVARKASSGRPRAWRLRIVACTGEGESAFGTVSGLVDGRPGDRWCHR
jgi:hypothetical protein